MARAMELAGRDLTTGRGLTPDHLVAIGSELGIDEVHVRQALTEVLSEPPRVRALDRSVTAVRHVEHTPVDCERLLAAWFEEADGLRALRRTGPQLAIWAPRSGFVAGTKAAISSVYTGRRAEQVMKGATRMVASRSRGDAIVRAAMMPGTAHA